tara:strand:- start:277 stop:459 length:183 start_codon:yes stop_codon:yes gene_type:complete
MSKKLSKMSRVERIKYWKDKYRNTPNGYWVSMKIGEEYISDIATLSKQQRERRKRVNCDD